MRKESFFRFFEVKDIFKKRLLTTCLCTDKLLSIIFKLKISCTAASAFSVYSVLARALSKQMYQPILVLLLTGTGFFYSFHCLSFVSSLLFFYLISSFFYFFAPITILVYLFFFLIFYFNRKKNTHK